MLAMAMDIGTESARADFDPDAGGPVIAFNGNQALLTNGECWSPTPPGWTRVEWTDPPIPIVEIAFWEDASFIATNGDFWWSDGTVWHNNGAPPEGTPAGSSNWSQLKSSFGK